MKLFLLLMSIFYSSMLFAQDYSKIRITSNYALWTRPYFTDDYTTGSLPKDTEAEILNYEKKSQGYGVEVRITTDPHKGKTGWIYYHTEPDRRKFEFVDDQGKSYSENISGKTSEFMDHFKTQENNLNLRKKKMALLQPNNDDITDIDKVLENIKNGTYLIDTNKDDGGPFIPIIRTVKNPDGTKSLETFFIPRSYSELISFAEKINQSLYLNFNETCKLGEQDQPQKNQGQKSNSRFTAGCEILEKDASSWDENQLKVCLDNLRTKVGGKSKSLNRKSVFQKMFALEPEEQEFIGSVLTLYGESRSSSDEESLIVLQTFQNRKDDARKSCKNANLLDVTLQAWQFSMWNNSDPNWKKAISLKEEEKSPPIEISEGYQLKRMAKLYKKFKRKDFHVAPSDVKKIERISHYRTRAMDNRPSSVPSWGTARDSTATIRVNKMNIGSLNKNSQVDHYFFEDVAWKFKYHSYRPRKSGEGKCY